MSGDFAPTETLRGAVLAAEKFDAEIILVGDRKVIEKTASELQADISRFEIIQADSVVTMEDDPLCVLHAKRDSSICVGLRLLADGGGDVFISAGNTGALFTAATLIVRKLPGVQRAAIASVLPMNPPLLLLDAGANVTVTDEYLEQFAVMGSVYMRKVFGLESPRVGLLNNGAEECKGTQLQIDAYKRLGANENINFVGNIEANRIPNNACDVLVTDGFTGNILLKSIEGMGKLMAGLLRDNFNANIRTKAAGLLMKDRIGVIKSSFDASTYGGAPLLGLRRPVIKAHGSSKSKAIMNAVGQAISYTGTGVTDQVAEVLKTLKGKS